MASQAGQAIARVLQSMLCYAMPSHPFPSLPSPLMAPIPGKERLVYFFIKNPYAMKRLAQCLFVPLSLLIATAASAQVQDNGGAGGMNTPASGSMSQPTTTTPSTNVGTGQQSNLGSPAGKTTTFPAQVQTEQQKIQDSINRAERKAKKEAKKAEKKAEKAKKKADKDAEKADTSDTGAVMEKNTYLKQEAFG